ncbi:transposase [Dyadobacter jejuensis]
MVDSQRLESFRTESRSIQTHYADILNFFVNRSTNASAGSFNRATVRAKIKAFRATSRGVKDVSFFLFRLSRLYA